jgi:hypothetical protein
MTFLMRSQKSPIAQRWALQKLQNTRRSVLSRDLTVHTVWLIGVYDLQRSRLEFFRVHLSYTTEKTRLE